MCLFREAAALPAGLSKQVRAWLLPSICQDPGPWAHWTFAQKQRGHSVQIKGGDEDRSGVCWPPPSLQLLLLNYHNLKKSSLSSDQPFIRGMMSRGALPSQPKPT